MYLHKPELDPFVLTRLSYPHMGMGLGHRGGPSLAAGPRGGSAEGGLFSKNLIHRGGSGILKVSEGGLYISPCKTPILFIVLPQL